MPVPGGAPRKPRVVAKKPKPPAKSSWADKVLQKPAKPRVVKKAAPLGGRAVHDVVAATQAVSKGKPVPKPTVRPRKTLKDLAGYRSPVLKAKTESGSGKLGSISAAASVALPMLAAVDAATGAKGPKTALKILKNAPVDAADLAVGTPAALYHLGDTAIHHPGKVPGLLAQPYKELAKNPRKFVTEHPVSSVLMAAPAVRVPSRAAGAALRGAGKQTLARESATLPGTALKVARVKSRDPVRNAIQTKLDAKRGTPTITAKPSATIKGRTPRATELERRVDQSYDASKKQTVRVMKAAAASAKKRGYDQAKGAEHVSGAVGGAKRVFDRRFGEEFGSTWYHDPKSGALVKPKNAEKGRLHSSKDAAQKVADAVNERGVFKAVVRSAGKHAFAVVPETAAERLRWHGQVGKSKAVGAVTFRETRRAFGRAVLPFSKNFLAGQAVEAAFRSAVEGAGPVSYARGVRTLGRMSPQDAKALRDRTVGDKSTQTGHAGHAAEYLDGAKTLSDALGETNVAALAQLGRGMTKAGKAPLVKQVRGGFHAWSNVVFKHFNSTIERAAQTAMLGKHIKHSALGERHVIGLTSKAIDEYAHGMSNTANMAAATDAIHRMYGKYKAFPPAVREALMHTTPFLPWYINTARFLLRLPVDHPVHAALLADVDAATEEWRKAHGYSLRGGAPVPDFLAGGPIGRWLPFAPKDVSGSVGGLVLPQIVPSVINLQPGVDWKGKPIKGSKSANAALSLVESMVPGVAQIDRATGLGDTHVRHKKDAKSVLNGKTFDEVKADLIKQVDVTTSFKTKPLAPPTPAASGRPVLKAPTVKLKGRPVLKSTRVVLK